MADESTEAVENEDQQSSATGADSEEGKAEQREERDPPAGESGDGDDSGSGEGEGEEASASEKAKEKEEERDKAAEKIKELEEGDPPDDLEDWPDDAAKYETFGGAEGDHGYHEGPEEEKLGPSSLRHKQGGGVAIAGEEVDDPDEYKSDPIPGGPTDPDAKQDLTQKKIRESQGRDIESQGEDDGGGNDDDDDSSDEKTDDDS